MFGSLYKSTNLSVLLLLFIQLLGNCFGKFNLIEIFFTALLVFCLGCVVF